MKKFILNSVNGRIMLRGIMLLNIVFVFSISALNAQQYNITLQYDNTTLETVLNEIKNQTDINIVFNHEEINKAPRIKVSVKNVTLKEALDNVLLKTSLEFEIRNNTVIIKPKKESQNQKNEKPELNLQVIRGRVIDKDSKAGLPFSNIVVLNADPIKGVTSDEEGYFKIENLSVGRYTLQFSYVGYENSILPEILVGSGKQVILTIELSENLQDVDEVVVSVKKGEPLNDMATVSGKSFSVEETKRYAASISDPARMAQVFAGVSTTDDASNEIVIRGNSPNWMLWRLEGVEIPSPNHFAEEGYNSGAVSILSTNMLGKSDFYTGAFPAEYGNTLSGVFDLRLRNGNNERREYSAQIGLLGAEFAAEGPFKKGYRGSYLLNYRYATFSLLNDLNIEVSENALPNYQDLSFKIYLPTKKAGTFSLWGIGGKSDAVEKYLPDTSLNENIDYGYYDNTNTGMYATGISHTLFPDKKSYIKSVISMSGNYSTNQMGDMDTLGFMHDVYNDDFNSGAIRFTSLYNRKISNKLIFRTGITLSHLNFDYFAQSTNDNYKWEDAIDGSGMTDMTQAYIQTKYKFDKHITITGGIHYNHFALSGDNSIEPRLGVQLDLKNNQKVGFGFGMHSKNEQLPVYFVDFDLSPDSESYLNKSLKLTKSTHYIASYENLIHSDWRIKTEVYYQDISQLPVPNNKNKKIAPVFNGISPLDTLINEGKGRNYGLEFTVQKFFTNNYYLLFSSSLFQSEYKPLDGTWYNTRFNSNYIFNLVGGKEIPFGDNKMLSLNGKLLWTGGKRIIPIDVPASIESGYAEFDMDAIYSEKAPDYFRIDLGVKLHFYKKNTEHVIALDIQNTTNRLNVWSYIYDVNNDKILTYYMAGIIPVISYRIEF